MIRPQDLPTQMAKTFQVKLMVWLERESWVRIQKTRTILFDVCLVSEPSQAKWRAQELVGAYRAKVFVPQRPK
jgi:hypothetical protein